MCEWRHGSWNWKLLWRRRLYEWEEGYLQDLIACIENDIPDRGKRDRDHRVIWKWSGDGNFSSMSLKCYESVELILPKSVTDIIWKNIAPRAQLTLWLACLEKLKTGDFIWERNHRSNTSTFPVLRFGNGNK